MKTLGWLYWATIQAVTWGLLFPIGVVLCFVLAITHSWTYDVNVNKHHWRGHPWTWLWDNDEDGILPRTFMPNASEWWAAYIWTGWRNSVNNLRYLVLWKGGPWFQVRRWGWYYQMGFRPDTGWPVWSAGAGLGTQLP